MEVGAAAGDCRSLGADCEAESDCCGLELSDVVPALISPFPPSGRKTSPSRPPLTSPNDFCVGGGGLSLRLFVPPPPGSWS